MEHPDSEMAHEMQMAGTGFMETLTEAMQKLQEAGYTENFGLSRDCLKARDGSICIRPEEFVVDDIRRFDDASDPDDQAILFAISSEKHGVKGLLINSYGARSEQLTNEMEQRLRDH